MPETTMAWPDLLVPVWLVAVWVGYVMLADHPQRGRTTLMARMHQYRQAWMRRMLEGSGLDPDEPVSRDDFIEMQEQARERMRQGGFGRGGGGFGGGGPGNGGFGNGGFGGGGFGRGGFGGGRFSGGRGGDDENDEDGDDEDRDVEQGNRRGGRGPFGGPGGFGAAGGQGEKSQGSSAGSNSAAEFCQPRLASRFDWRTLRASRTSPPS